MQVKVFCYDWGIIPMPTGHKERLVILATLKGAIEAIKGYRGAEIKTSTVRIVKHGEDKRVRSYVDIKFPGIPPKEGVIESRKSPRVILR